MSLEFPYAKLVSSALLGSLFLAGFSSNSSAQNASHPEAKSPLVDNPYIKHTDPWRWDVKSQLFLRTGVRYYHEAGFLRPSSSRERVESISWPLDDLEVVFPVLRTGSYFWSPNLEVSASIRTEHHTNLPDPERMYTKLTGSEYTRFQTDIDDDIYMLHITHTSHVVSADTVFDHKKALQLPWPDQWSENASRFLSPKVDSVGYELEQDADDIVEQLVSFWVEEKDPKIIPQLELVKFLTGKVIEHVQVRNPPSEIASQIAVRFSEVSAVTGSSWSGLVVRSADQVALEPDGTKHDLATLLTAVLRCADVPARVVVCIDQTDDDVIEQMISMVEFAMYAPELDLTFWVPIDVDRLRLNGKRASQYQQWWNYFGSHDELNDYVPIANYFHPPAEYRGYDLPALYGIRSTSQLPDYAVQTLLVDPQVSPISIPMMYPEP